MHTINMCLGYYGSLAINVRLYVLEKVSWGYLRLNVRVFFTTIAIVRTRNQSFNVSVLAACYFEESSKLCFLKVDSKKSNIS